MTRSPMMLVLLGVALLGGDPAPAQSPPATESPSVAQKMRNIIDSVLIERATARQAFAWWSHTTDIPLILDWANMQAQGIDPDRLLSLRLEHVPADQLLNLLIQQTRTDRTPLIVEPSPWYVQVMTQRQANREPVTRIYDVASLLMETPHFTDAPRLNLHDALSNTPTGGSSSNLLSNEKSPPSVRHTTRQQRGENLAQLIRESIEPTLWRAHGGDVASITYFEGRLIVRAPRYLQRQIGTPPVRQPKVVAPGQPAHAASTHQHTSSHISGIALPSSSISGQQGPR